MKKEHNSVYDILVHTECYTSAKRRQVLFIPYLCDNAH